MGDSDGGWVGCLGYAPGQVVVVVMVVGGRWDAACRCRSGGWSHGDMRRKVGRGMRWDDGLVSPGWDRTWGSRPSGSMCLVAGVWKGRRRRVRGKMGGGLLRDIRS